MPSIQSKLFSRFANRSVQSMFVNFDVRWMDIDTDAEVSPVGLEFDVDIDPFVYSLTLGWKF